MSNDKMEMSARTPHTDISHLMLVSNDNNNNKKKKI